MKHFRNRPAVRRAAIISVAAAAPLLLASCGGAPVEEHPADPGKAQSESISQPKQVGSMTKTVQPEQVVQADTDVSAAVPASAPEAEAEIFISEAAPVALTPDRGFHTVSSGDTLEGIAEAMGWGDWHDVAEYNNIPAPHILFEGQKISAPASSHVAAAPVNRPAAVFTPASTEPVKEAASKAPAVTAPVEAPAPVVEAPVEVAPEPEFTAPVELTEVEKPVITEPVEEPAAEQPVEAPVVEAPVVVTPAPDVAAPAPAAPEPVIEPAPAPVSPAPAAPVEVIEPAAPAPAAGSTAFAQRSLELINEYRAANGVHALVYDERLEAMAVNWAGSQKAEIEANGWAGIAHNPNLASELPAGWTNYGENIAVNYSPEDMFTWWTNSPAHNASMLSPALDAFGFGSAELDIFTGNHVGVQVFARY